jgi:hypothetical protein
MCGKGFTAGQKNGASLSHPPQTFIAIAMNQGGK